ncbi:MAG: hypothetical protein MJY70_01415 [Bacteroidales bacterium]|nr:hypothetical protein [Bacteroidales bacterium]
MKKILIFAAIAAVLSLTSCQKEVPVENVKADTSTVVEPPVFTATISPGTKTTVDAQTGKVSWETTDEITVTDKNKNAAVYKIKSIDGTTGKATFEYKSGTQLGDGPYTATYGTAPATNQAYSASPSKLYMTAPQTSTKSFTFTVQCGLMEINLTKEGESVKSVAVSGIPKGGSATTYTLTCSDPQSIGTKKPFYIAVPAGDYYNIVIKDPEGKDCTLTAASGLAVAANHIKPVTFDGSKLVFKHSKLTGVFSVSATKKVQFSRGNLVATIGTNGTPIAWKFAANQYARLGEGGANKAIGKQAGDVDLFGWSADNKYGINTSTNNGDYSQAFSDWGKAIDDNTWRTLDVSEWNYLIGIDEGTIRTGKAVGPYTVCGVQNCLILVPDDFVPGSVIFPTDRIFDSAKWKTAEDAGFVCLPPDGNRSGNEVNMVENGYYWSSTKHNSDSGRAYGVEFWSDNTIIPNSDGARYEGRSVRLVTDVQ